MVSATLTAQKGSSDGVASGLGFNRSLIKILLYAVVPAVAALITWLTGSLVYWYGGFPLYWRTPFYSMRQTCIGVSCPPPPSFYDLSWRTIDNWGAFIFDMLFYTAIGYSFLFGYVVYDQPRQALRPTTSRMSAGICTRASKSQYTRSANNPQWTRPAFQLAVVYGSDAAGYGAGGGGVVGVSPAGLLVPFRR